MSAAAADMSDVRGHALPIMSGAALGTDWMGSRQGAAASLWDLSPGGRWWEQGGGHGQVGLKEAAVKQETDRQPWMGPSVRHHPAVWLRASAAIHPGPWAGWVMR